VDLPLRLTSEERAIVEGAEGEAAQLAMRILTRVAPLYGATSLLAVSRAHIDGCIYTGDAGLAFAERLAMAGGKVKVPTTLNVMSMDRVQWRSLGQDPGFAARARRLGEAYLTMGAAPTFTCAPYQTVDPPGFGEQIAWSESNAVAYANSALGARTNRYGDYLDICCALTGRAPAAGLHLDEHRLATTLVVLDHVPTELQERTDFWAVLGYWLGTTCPTDIPVVDGLAVRPTDDQMKAFCAAAATTGAHALVHLAGITPEAPDARTALGGKRPKQTLRISLADLRTARQALTTTGESEVDVVAFGSPHSSLEECRAIAILTAGQSVSPGVQVFVTTSAAVKAIAGRTGILAELERFGAIVTADTCIAVAPLVRPGARVLMTNSAKYAHYGPGLIGVDSVFGSTEDCIRSAVAGRVLIDEGPWG
jgi:predicted aconitase